MHQLLVKRKATLTRLYGKHIDQLLWCNHDHRLNCIILMQVVWRGYVQSMLQASFTSDLVLYAASGLLTYGANDGESLTVSAQP